MKHLLYIGIAAVCMSLSGCNDYLSKNPNEGGDEILHKSEQIDALFGNSTLLTSFANYTLSSSDDFGWTTDIMDQVPIPEPAVFNGIAWDVKGVESQNTGDETWTAEFKRIFYANLIINGIDQVEDLTPDKKANDLAQAHFLRALANWELVSIYCRPYAKENLSTPGLPLKQTTSYEESQKRATLEETYHFIEKDLLEAFNSTSRSDIEKRWLVSKPAVAAMLSRFYLFTQDYAKAIQYADEALKSRQAALVDYNTLIHIEHTYGGDDGGLETTLLYPEFWGYSAAQYTDFQESYFSAVTLLNESCLLYPSQTLLQLYDQKNDLRFDQFFVKGGLQENSITVDKDDYVYHTFNNDWRGPVMMTGPGVPEVLLNKAEAEARAGNLSEAMQTVNLLRVKRMRKGAKGLLLTATSQEEAIQKILDERHREMPFIMRWQDIRRLAFNNVTFDDIEPRRTFYLVENNKMDKSQTREYVLPVKSPRYAQPLSAMEIKRSGNQLIQNEY